MYANTGKNEYDRNPRDSGYPYLLFLGKRDPIPGTDSFFLDFPPSKRETLEPWKSWNEKAKGERKRRRKEGRGKKEFRPSLLLFPLSPHERRYKRRNTSCLVNITGYRPCLGDRNVGQRRAPLPLCIHRSRGSTPRFGAVTTDEFRMSPANGKQRAGR